MDRDWKRFQLIQAIVHLARLCSWWFGFQTSLHVDQIPIISITSKSTSMGMRLTFWGAVWPSMTFQWNTSLSVTIPNVVSFTQVQNGISSFIKCAPTFCFVPRLNSCSWRPAICQLVRVTGRVSIHLRAMIFSLGCIIAESAVTIISYIAHYGREGAY